MAFKDDIYQNELTTYFYMEELIDNAISDLEELRYRHKNRNYYTRTSFNDLGFHTQGFNIEREVNDFVSAEQMNIDRIKRLKLRQERFNHLLDCRLSPDEKNYLESRYRDTKDIKERPEIEIKALTIIDEMEEYKFELSKYKRNRYDRADLLKEQRVTVEKPKHEDGNYNEWLDEIVKDKELAERWSKNGILERLMKLA